MEETQQQKSIFGFFQMMIYVFIAVDIYTQCLSFSYNDKIVVARLNNVLYKIPFFVNALYSHITLFIMLAIIAILTQSKKDMQFDIHKHFTYFFCFGILLFVASIFAVMITGHQLRLAAYSLSYYTGAVFLHVAFSNLSKKVFAKVKQDIWNAEEESFQQNEKLVEGDYIFNLSISFYFRKKIRQGWINANVFRGIMVLGVPGSGKSESVIIPYMKQFLHRGFSMLVFDFKYPDLGKIAYYHYILNHVNGGPLKDHAFHAINLENPEYSRRTNPIQARYIQTLGDASETAEAIITALTKTDKPQGSSQFFTQSAINFLAACIYYLSKLQDGRYSTLAHIMALVSMPYDRLFMTLFSNRELLPILAPFKSAYDNRSFEQLDGQLATVRINISRIATKEAFWVFSANDFDLKISKSLGVVVLASSPDTQSMNSAFYSTILMRLIKLVNSKGNHPVAIVVDEAPTISLYKIENLIATARSHRVAVLLGLQELTQFIQQYGRDVSNTIVSVMGTILSGAARNKDTLAWLETLFGKIKQTSTGFNIDRNKTGVNLNEKLDWLVPASKIANLNAGEIVGLVSRENEAQYGTYKTNVFNGKVNIDFDKINEEKKRYIELPKYYNFGTAAEKEQLLLANMEKIFKEVQSILL